MRRHQVSVQRHRWIGLLGLLVTSLSAEEAPLTLSLQTFDEVWQTVNDSYYDPDFAGLDWAGMKEKYRPDAERAAHAKALRPILNAMLGELGESHFGVFPSSSDLEEASLLTEESGASASSPPSEKEAEGEKVEDPRTPDGSYTGIHLRKLGARVLITAVDAGSPAAASGVRPGEWLVRLGSMDVARFLEKAANEAKAHFSQDYFVLQVLGELAGRPKNGKEQTFTLKPPRGKVRTVSVRPTSYPGEMSPEIANLPATPLRFETRKLPLPEGDVVYLRFNIFLPQHMAKIRSTILEASEAVGMIIDIRGNPGGIGMMANGIGGVLTEEQYSLGTMTMRSGEVHFVAYPQRNAYTGPLVILIDRMSASTSEIFAGGLQDAGRARVVGRPSMGAALPSFIRTLPNGDRFQHAIANLTTAKGRRLEGRGVIPNEPVRLKPKALYQGRDPDIERAMKVLRRELKKG